MMWRYLVYSGHCNLVRDTESIRISRYHLVCDEIERVVCKLFVVNVYVKEWYYEWK